MKERLHHWTSLGLRLALRCWGDEGAPPLVMLHGFLDSGAAFRPMAERLARHWRVLVPDHRGHGLSEHVGAGGYYHFPDYVLDLDALFACFGLEQAVVVGHSMGSTIACYFAGTWPERVRALVLLDGVGPPFGSVRPEDAPARMRQWVADVRAAEGQETAGEADLAAMARRLGRASPRASDERLLEIAGHSAIQGEDGRWRWRFDPLHRTRSPLAFDPERFLAFLARISCPTLAIWAERSPMQAADAGARLATLADARTLTLPDVGHNLHHEAPEAVAGAIDAFLASAGLQARDG